MNYCENFGPSIDLVSVFFLHIVNFRDIFLYKKIQNIPEKYNTAINYRVLNEFRTYLCWSFSNHKALKLQKHPLAKIKKINPTMKL